MNKIYYIKDITFERVTQLHVQLILFIRKASYTMENSRFMLLISHGLNDEFQNRVGM